MKQPSLTFQRLAEEDFFSLIGLESLSDQEKSSILRAIGRTVQVRVFQKLYESLSLKERAEYDKLPSEAVLPFFAKKGFNLAEMILSESLSYKIELAGLFQVATSSLASSVA